MSDKPTKPDKPERARSSKTKKLRDQQIIAKAMTGQTTGVIAKELNCSRTTVSEVLNSDQVKEIIKGIDKELAKGVDDAVKTVLKAVKYDYVAARDLLKNFGSMKQQVNLNHTFPRPTVIERMDGSQVVLGTEEDENEHSD